MSIFNSSMFDSIKDALTKDTTSNKYENIMRFQPGNSYTVRLLPNIADPAQTFFHYYSHAWESFSTGQFMNYLSPTTWGEKDPIAEMRFRIYHHGTEAEKERSKAIIRRENWLVNAYVVNDPIKPDNNGTIKIIRFGRQLHKIIMEAIQGEDAEQFGSKIFDLSPDGCNFRIKVDKQSNFPTYVSSKFLMPSEIKGLAEDQYDTIYKGCHKLDDIFKVRSYEELETALHEHYLLTDATQSTTDSVESTVEEPASSSNSSDDDVPYTFDSNSSVQDKETAAAGDVSDDKINELLKGLDA